MIEQADQSGDNLQDEGLQQSQIAMATEHTAKMPGAWLSPWTSVMHSQ